MIEDKHAATGAPNGVDLGALTTRTLIALKSAVWDYDSRIDSDRIHYLVEVDGVVLGCQAATHADARGYIDAFRELVGEELDSRAIAHLHSVREASPVPESAPLASPHRGS